MAARQDRPTPFVPSLDATASPQYVFFGGKGGTGKTTCAAAAAIASAERGRRVLVVSTDPAHSLGDALGRRLTVRPSKVPVRRGSLRACELDADRALTRWLVSRRPALTTIVERGTWLDRADVESFLDLSLPGVDELLGLLEVERLGGGGTYDQVVVDTAPTGHTLRLLATPAIFVALARVFDLIQEKHRVLAAAFGPGSRGDPSEAFIDELRADGERLGALLRDRSRTRLCWVMLAELLSVAESARAIARLRADGIRVADVVVNRLTPVPPSRCALCEGRRRAEAESLRSLSTRIGGRSTAIWTLPARDEPAQGSAALRMLARDVSPLGRTLMPTRRPPAQQRKHSTASRAVVTLLAGSSSTRLLIAGGKGGVGKTTCATALALAIARDDPARRVLLLSTDPAHSIGDVLGQPIGDRQRRVRGGPANLLCREIDAAKGWRDRAERYRESVAHVFETLAGGSNVDLAIDRAIIEELFQLAPPGIDEVTGMLTIIDALSERFDLVMIDTAPTGHALRLLAVPGQAKAWVREFIGVLLKYRLVAGFGPLTEELLSLSRDLERLEELLTDAEACGFLVVTRPELLPVLETVRLIDWLRRHRIARRALIINGLTPRGCRRCRRAAAREKRQVAALMDPAWKRGGGTVIATDAVAPPPRGVRPLNAWWATWRIQSRAAAGAQPGT